MTLPPEIARKLKLRVSALDQSSHRLEYDDVLRALARLAAGKALSPEATNLLHAWQLHAAVAIGYELIYSQDGGLTRAISAARAGRAASRPRDALRVFRDVDVTLLDPHDKAMVLTPIAAAFADLRELAAARPLAEEAVRCNRFWSDHPHRVLARIAGYQGRSREAEVRWAQAEHVEAFRESDRSALDNLGFDGPPTDAPLFAGYEDAVATGRVRSKRWYAEYLSSSEWMVRRAEARRLAHDMCERCGQLGLLHVHHTTYRRVGKELPTDLEVLCPACHTSEHDVENKALEKLRLFASDAQIIGDQRCQAPFVAPAV